MIVPACEPRPEPSIFDLSSAGRIGVNLPALDVPAAPLPAGFLRQPDDLPLPEVAEIDVMRHFVRLSQKNHCIDTGFYPLGSCTMKYNPKVHERAARLPGFVNLHPMQPASTVQGAMQLIFELQVYLAEISGFAAVSLQPAAGAQGELAGVLMMRNYLHDLGQTQRTKILVPDSAHGTNPASTAMAGLQAVEIPSDAQGNVDLAALQAQLDTTGHEIVGLMLTNPNTLGLFEAHVLDIIRMVHDAGGLVYGDGANLNAILGIAKPGELGFDVMHFNLHKTFTTPHGGGGPGAGPVGCSEALAPYLPGPVVAVRAGEDEDEIDLLWYMPHKTSGRLKSFAGNFAMLVRAYTYIRMLGAEGLRAVSENAVLNANYLQASLKDVFPVPHGDRTCMHEFVAQGIIDEAPGIHTMDIAKRLMDYGIHPPTVYFPLIVHEALMIEPTETESKETLDAFVNTMIEIKQEAIEAPELLKEAPHRTPVGRLDEVRAARDPKLCDNAVLNSLKG